MNILSRIKTFFKKEAVLCVSGILAFISCLFVPINIKYIEYIDIKTLALLFCLMIVMSGFQKMGFFENIANLFLKNIKSQRGLVLILIFLCFFTSMLITNDVALITFIPFAILILKMANMEYIVCLTVVLMTISANLGSMLTPLGNPQNLYLYSISNISIPQFILITLPYVLISGVLLFFCIFLYKRRNIPQEVTKNKMIELDKRKLYFFITLFLICILAVVGVINYKILILIILLSILFIDKKLILKVDYSLLLTFIFFFVFIGNMRENQIFRNFIENIIVSREKTVSIIISQIISNVPCALLLSGFTDNYKELIIGTNLGGLGTLIASMASLISYKQIVTQYPTLKIKYLISFTIFNVVFLVILFIFSLFI